MRLEGHDLCCVRGGREVFARVRFSVTPGEVLVVTGPNGAGKSSLLRIIAGLLRPAEGMIRVADEDPDVTLAELIHYVGHQDASKAPLTVTENLRFWAGFLGGGQTVSPAALSGALRSVGLHGLADLPAAYLSAGQRRRLSLARLLAVQRPIWLLDEPTTALDRPAQDRLAALMADHIASGGIIVAAAHGPIGLNGAKELRLGGAA